MTAQPNHRQSVTWRRLLSCLHPVGVRILRPLLVAAVFSLAAGCGSRVVNHIFLVTSSRDAGDDTPGDGNCRTGLFATGCTLRAALEEANALDGFDGIVFNLPAGDLTIRPQTALPVITGELILDGILQPGYDEDPIIILDGSDLEIPPFVNGLETAAGSDVTIRGLQVVHFSKNGILARGRLELKHVFASYNRDSGFSASGDPAPFAVEISDSEFTENTLHGIAAGNIDLTIDRSRIADNRWGGMSVADGSLVLEVVTIEDNYSYTTGGGISLVGSVDASFTEVEILNNGATDVGGGVYLRDSGGAELTLEECTITRNESSVGGGMYIQGGDVFLDHGNVLIDNSADSGGGGIYINGGTVKIEGSTIGETGHRNDPDANNDGFGAGGGIFNDGGDLEVLASSISGNRRSGIYSLGGTVYLAWSEVVGNGEQGVETHGDGATMDLEIHGTVIGEHVFYGIGTTDTNLLGADNWIKDNGGAGINMERGQLWFSRSTLQDNGHGMYLNQLTLAEIYGSTIMGNHHGWEGGGIHMTGDPAATLRLENVTIHDNSAVSTGGGLEVNGVTAFLNNVTLSENSAPEGGGIHSTGTVYIENTILDENPGGNCSGEITSLGYNIDHSTTCPLFSPGDQSNTEVTLGPLQDNGGPTFTRAISAISDAFDAGNDATCAATDQRTVIRPQGAHCDIGAFEFEAGGKSAATPFTPTPTPDITPTPTPTLSTILFDPVEISSDTLYKGGKTCKPLTLTVKVRVQPAAQVSSVGLFYRIVAKEGGNSIPWSEGLAMTPAGNGWYALTLIGDDLPSINKWQSEAWLEFQFVANNSNNQPIAWSQVYRQVTYKPCYN